MLLGVGGGAGVVEGQQQYTSAGTYSWTPPAGVSSVSVVAIGGGGAGAIDANEGSHNGGGGGACAYKNNISVSAGSTHTVVVGAGARANIGEDGGDSYFSATSVLKAVGGHNPKHSDRLGGAASDCVGDGAYSLSLIHI